MGKFDMTKEEFESNLVDGTVVVQLRSEALDIVTKPAMNREYFELLESINESPELRGYVQMHEGHWDSRQAVQALAQFISQDDEMYSRAGRYYGYLHEVVASRFKNSIGRILLTLMELDQPTVAGLRGVISGEYLGLTLAFDARVATVDTQIAFDNVRTGWLGSPGLTHLMPRYVGAGAATSLIHSGSTIDASQAHAIGLITEIVDTGEELDERCRNKIAEIGGNHRHLAKLHRQQILPPHEEIRSALERYNDGMAKSVFALRRSTGSS